MISDLNTDKTVAISHEIKWVPIDQHTPRGVKLQLISKPAGVAQYGVLQGDNNFYTHWYPVPTFSKDEA